MIDPAPDRASKPRRLFADYIGMLLALGLLIIIFGRQSDHFFTVTNFRTIANQIPAAVVVAVGMTFVLISGGIDLSVGSVLALCAAALGYCLVGLEWPLPAALLMTLGAGATAGALNGLIVTKWRLPSFIVTLGVLEAARGGAYLISGSRTQYVGDAITPIAEASILGLSLPFLLAIAIVVAGEAALRLTVFGRYALAIGNNEEVVRLSGVNTARVRRGVFTLCGLLTAVGAVIHTARLGAADPNAGVGMELEAIAAVVIGGTSLTGGRGSVVRSLFGVLIIAVLGNGLAQAGAQESTKRIITGAVIIAAVVFDRYRHGKGLVS